MIKEITAQMREAQRKQNEEGHLFPDQTQVFTFPAPAVIRWWLKVQRYAGLTFERFNGEWWGVFRAQK